MPITPFSTAPTPSDTPQVFNQRGFQIVSELARFVTEANALESNVNTKESSVTSQHADLTTKYNDFITKYGDVTTKYADIVARSNDVVTKHGQVTDMRDDIIARQSNVVSLESDAADSASAAASSAATAQIYATQTLTGTSSTSLTPAAGTVTFTMEPNKGFVIGQYIVMTSASAQDHKMGGPITAYNKATGLTSISVASDAFYGSTAKTDWVIGLSAQGSLVSLSSLYRGAYAAVSNGGTLVANKRYKADTTSGAIAMSLPTPANCGAGDEITLMNHNGKWRTNAFTVNCPANVTIYDNIAEVSGTNLVCDTNQWGSIRLACSNHTGTAAEWVIQL